MYVILTFKTCKYHRVRIKCIVFLFVCVLEKKTTNLPVCVVYELHSMLRNAPQVCRKCFFNITSIFNNLKKLISRVYFELINIVELETMKPQMQSTKPKHTFFENKSSRVSNKEDHYEDEYYETPKKWFEEITDDPKGSAPVTEQQLIELKEEAKKCHDTECANNNIKNSKTNKNYQFVQTIMSKGTVSDKIAAYTVAIQDNPVYSLDTLRNLVGMVKVGKKKECIQVMETLTELFITSLLRNDTKLLAFHQRPLSLINELSSGNAITRRKILSFWYFEDQLKEVYTSFVLALNNVAHDTIDSNKEKSISCMYKLLSGNPEQEKNLLIYIVNKLGDPSQQVASKATYCLSQLLFKHSNMQEVVLGEVEKLIFRANISPKAQYYGLCFLSQFYLCHEAPEVARRLIEVYFSFFKSCIKKGEVDSRMMSALLMGVNRAYPYAKLELEKIAGHIDTIYRIVHIANFNIGLHALTLLYQVSDYANNINDRFYSALYKKLVDPKLFTTTHQAMVLNLLYKALMKDTEVSRIRVFVKRLLELSMYVQPAFACGFLYLVSQIIAKKEGVQALILKQTSFKGFCEDGDEDEHYNDVQEKVGELNDQKSESCVEMKEKLANKRESGWDHLKISKKGNNQSGFNPQSRNPLYAGGELCAFTELYNLKRHFHPTIALYAEQLLESKSIHYSGDPLKDFTLIRFLDRFVFKNPKKLEENGGVGAHPTFGKRKSYKPSGLRALSVTSAGYLNEDLKKIPVDELFLHTYLKAKYRNRKEKDEDVDDDLESVEDDEFEDMLDKMAGLSKDDEEDADVDFMADIGDTLKTKYDKKAKKRSKDDDSNEGSGDEELSGNDELSGEEVDDEDDDLGMDDDDQDLFEDLEDDEDEDIEFGGGELSEDDEQGKKGKKGKMEDGMGAVFASAEEFAQILDDEGSSKVKPGSSNAFENRDNAGVHQLAWEEKRNHWLSGYNKAIGKGKGMKFDKGNFRGKRKSSENRLANKNKKFKK